MLVVRMTEDQRKALTATIDIAVKHLGISGLETLVPLLQLLGSATQEEPADNVVPMIPPPSDKTASGE